MAVRLQRPRLSLASRGFVSHDGVIHRAIEELVQGLHQFELAKHLERSLRKSLGLQEPPDLLPAHGQRPRPVAQGDSLGRQLLADLPVALLDLRLSLVQQPVA